MSYIVLVLSSRANKYRSYEESDFSVVAMCCRIGDACAGKGFLAGHVLEPGKFF